MRPKFRVRGLRLYSKSGLVYLAPQRLRLHVLADPFARAQQVVCRLVFWDEPVGN